MILKTEDGGDSWTRPTNGTSKTLESVAFANDGTTGWAVGRDGTILKTEDGGDSWTARTSGTPKTLKSVVFTSNDAAGWAVGGDGTILKTEDGGDTWTAHPSGTSKTLQSVAFTNDGITGWAVGRDGTILKTVNRGNFWSPRPSGVSADLYSVTFTADGAIGLAVGGSGTILRTWDGGDSWTPRTSGVSADLFSVMFTDDGATGLAVGSNSTILKTEDGGETWESLMDSSWVNYISVRFTDDGATGWVVGMDGTILKTEDGGDTWTPRTSERRRNLQSVRFTDDGAMGWAVGMDGTILKTRNGGRTWTPRPSGGRRDLYSVALAGDGVTGWAVGLFVTILKTEDGGDTWVRRRSASDSTQHLISVTFANDGVMGWAVGSGGTILKTQDGGESWALQGSGTSEYLRSVAFAADGTTGWAVGMDGTILKTVNAGENWASHSNKAWKTLYSVTFTNDGIDGWAVGRSGTILKTQDGGESWEPKSIGTAAHLRSVAFAADGATGWAVGSGGTILKTQDGGESWALKESGTSADLESVAFAADGVTGWIVGSDAILLTVDGGKTWRPLTASDYRKYPAPWTWMVFLLALLALWPAFRPLSPEGQRTGVADEFVSDRPITAGDPDPLRRGIVADTLSHFLRNENTEPPLTIAITGDWGEGKSSLMNLVRADLEKHGATTVWFNAWHHQKEDHLFAALLQAVRDQAIPSWLSVRGIPFRWRLLMSHCKSHLIWGIVAALVFGIWVAVLITENLHSCLALNFFWFGGFFSPPFCMAEDLNQKANFYNLLYLILNVVPPLLFLAYLYRGVTPKLTRWTVDPHRLLAYASRGALRFLRVTDFRNKLGLRYRFAEAFKEAAEALRPDALLIVVDDLDRCRPEQVVETLEAINFLTDAGSCYVVMGIAPEQVMHCVGLGFKEIAEEMADTSDGGTADNPKAWGREKRRVYARNYLEKLINIEVPIQTLTDEEAMNLAEPESDKGSPGMRRVFFGNARVVLACVVLVAALLGGIGIGSEWFETSLSEDSQRNQPVPPPDPISQPGNGNGATAPSPPPPPPVPNSEGLFRPGADDAVPQWSLLAPGGVVVLLVVAAMAIYIWRRREDRVQDSPRFTDALGIWHPLIRARTNSPRQMKRFVNRVRYLATATSGYENQQQPSESLIVALTTLQDLISDFTPGNEDESLLMSLADCLKKDLSDPIDVWLSKIPKNSMTEERKNWIRKELHDKFLNHRQQFKDEKVTGDVLTEFRKMTSRIVVR